MNNGLWQKKYATFPGAETPENDELFSKDADSFNVPTLSKVYSDITALFNLCVPGMH